MMILSWLRDSVLCNCVIQLNSQFRQTLIFFLTLFEIIPERNSILQDKTFLQQKEARKEGMISKKMIET